MGALSSLTGGGGLSASGGAAGPSQSGDTGATSLGGSFGISSPIVIGGYKSNGEATATSLPQLSPWLLGIAAFVVLGAIYIFRRKS